jgi:molybdopterin molybdotransferase
VSDSARPPLLPVAEALARILAAAETFPKEIETVPVAEGNGRVLARDLLARRTQPPADVSAMDGYAVCAADTDPPGKPLRLIGESAAGHPFFGAVRPGEATRIFTGALMPPGADAVLIQERAVTEGETLRSEITLAPGTYVRRAGRDFAAGMVGLKAGTRLTPGRIALAGAMNHAALPVFRRPRLALLATGDELVLPGAPDAADAIVATNAFAIAAMARAGGAEVRDLGISRDSAASLDAAFDAAEGWPADVLVTIGGASVGKHDLVRPVAAARGAALDFYKIAMRPGKPLNFGRLGPMLLVGLPGNPVSALVCARLFLLPLIAALQGDAKAGTDMSEPAVLGCALPANDERRDYLRAVLSRDADGRLVATPLEDQDSARLMVYAAADALVIRPPFAAPASAGAACLILRL